MCLFAIELCWEKLVLNTRKIFASSIWMCRRKLPRRCEKKLKKYWRQELEYLSRTDRSILPTRKLCIWLKKHPGRQKSYRWISRPLFDGIDDYAEVGRDSGAAGGRFRYGGIQPVYWLLCCEKYRRFFDDGGIFSQSRLVCF